MSNKETIGELARQLLELDEGELNAREKAVIDKVVRRLAVSRNINVELQRSKTFGQALADRVAEIGGSWSFIIGFGVVIAVWVSVNTWLVVFHAFDPYPFIFLNLMLSLLAAVQAPVILMSQNRAAARDRLAATHDYEVNLKAEIEIAALHEKLDQIRNQELATLIRKVAGEGGATARGRRDVAPQGAEQIAGCRPDYACAPSGLRADFRPHGRHRCSVAQVVRATHKSH